MIKRLIHIALVLAAASVSLVSCHTEDMLKAIDAPEGYVALRFTADIPAMQEVVTRSVDPDGGGVQNMTLFCFDSYGLFITTVTASIVQTGTLAGTFDAVVPDNTRTIHFLANQIMSQFSEDHFRNKSESEVMAVLEGSSGRMIYWARFSCAAGNEASIKDQMSAAGGNIEMIRNHAMITIDNPSNEFLEVTGFVACNTNAFGTVAPYHPEHGFDFVWPGDDFVTLPLNGAKMSDVTDVTTATSQYVFECENNIDDPVSVVIRGNVPGQTSQMYYRVMLMDENGEQLLIRRNHKYILHIAGTLSYGQTTFAEAMEAPATNNVWISISDEVHEVEDQNYILTVMNTDYVLEEEYAGKTYTLEYTLKGKNGTAVNESDKPTVTWIDNNVARQNIDNNFTVDEAGVGNGKIDISLLPLGDNEKLEGTLLVKKGVLQRKIKVIVIKKQSFAPSWVGTQVFGELNAVDPTSGRPHVTAMFTIPETCPEELFPMRVLISVNDLDVRSKSGQTLSVIREGDEGYGESNGIGYKYVYIAESTGTQRVYFESILNQVAGEEQTMLIEADHFETMERTFTFSDTRMSITVTGLETYSANSSSEFANDEFVFYRLVPQKKYANVQFDLQLRARESDDSEIPDGTPFNASPRDEFLLYSQCLDYYEDGDEGKAGVSAFDCTFYPDESATWWTANNPAGGRMLTFKPRDEVREQPEGSQGKYSIYMYTNRAVSAEVVRIASNLPEYPAVLSADANDEGKYSGNSYRSVTFELANYNPFRFAARVNGLGEDAVVNEGNRAEEVPEPVSSLEFTYGPDKSVDIEIDVTSFQGTDGKSVDPFGTEFEIYIDAPMLKIDASRLTDCNLDKDKLREEPSGSGHFIYTVSADRDVERNYGVATALKEDASAENQAGERKKLPFITSTSVTAGDIVISSDENMVVFFSKTFSISNKSISGTLQYMTADGQLHDVEVDSFVSFERVNNGSRIGAVTVTADGQYELRLRKEYDFNWYADEVELCYEDGEGNIYLKALDNLAYLSSNSNIVLELAGND